MMQRSSLLFFLGLFLLVLGLASCAEPTSSEVFSSPPASADAPSAAAEPAAAAKLGYPNALLALTAPACGPAGEGAGTLSGTASRVGAKHEDGIGRLSLYVLDTKAPAGEGAPDVCIVSKVAYEGVDLSSEEAGHPYTIGGLPPRAKPYHLLAIFEDNLAAGGQGALYVTDGEELNFPTVEVVDAAPVVFDLGLEFVGEAWPVDAGGEVAGSWTAVLTADEDAELEAVRAAAAAKPDDPSATTALAELTARLPPMEATVTADTVTLGSGEAATTFSYSTLTESGTDVLVLTSEASGTKRYTVTWYGDQMGWVDKDLAEARALRWSRK